LWHDNKEVILVPINKILRLSLLTGVVLNVAVASTISIAGNGSNVFLQETTGSTVSAPRSLGQTFVVPSPTTQDVLTDFAFSFVGTDSLLGYTGMIFQWDAVNTRATGPALYTSAARVGSQAPSFTGLSLALTPGTQYIALVTTQGVVNDAYRNGFLVNNSTDVYAGGAGFTQSSTVEDGSTGTGTWATQVWAPTNGNTDFAFTADFIADLTAVPEPASFEFVILAGLAGILSRSWLRRC